MMPSQRAAIVPTPPDTTLSYDQTAQLSTDGTFRGRVKIACLKFAESIMDESPGVTAHNVRMKWAANCFNQPDMVAGQIQQPTVIDPAVQSAGSDITDNALQAAVEGVINKMM
jgi:hypothetical protein